MLQLIQMQPLIGSSSVYILIYFLASHILDYVGGAASDGFGIEFSFYKNRD